MTNLTNVNTPTIPRMMTVRQVAATGILPESAIRRMLKENRISAVFAGKKAFINFDLLCQQLSACNLLVEKGSK